MKISADPLQPLRCWSELLVREPQHELYSPRGRKVSKVRFKALGRPQSRFELGLELEMH